MIDTRGDKALRVAPSTALARAAATTTRPSSGVAAVTLLALVALKVASCPPSLHFAVLGALTLMAGLPHLAGIEGHARPLVAWSAVLAPAQLALHGAQELGHDPSSALETSPGLAAHVGLLLANVGLVVAAIIAASISAALAVMLIAAVDRFAVALAGLRAHAPTAMAPLFRPRSTEVVILRAPWIAYAIRRGPPGPALLPI